MSTFWTRRDAITLLDFEVREDSTCLSSGLSGHTERLSKKRKPMLLIPFFRERYAHKGLPSGNTASLHLLERYATQSL